MSSNGSQNNPSLSSPPKVPLFPKHSAHLPSYSLLPGAGGVIGVLPAPHCLFQIMSFCPPQMLDIEAPVIRLHPFRTGDLAHGHRLLPVWSRHPLDSQFPLLQRPHHHTLHLVATCSCISSRTSVSNTHCLITAFPFSIPLPTPILFINTCDTYHPSMQLTLHLWLSLTSSHISPPPH